MAGLADLGDAFGDLDLSGLDDLDLSGLEDLDLSDVDAGRRLQDIDMSELDDAFAELGDMMDDALGELDDVMGDALGALSMSIMLRCGDKVVMTAWQSDDCSGDPVPDQAEFIMEWDTCTAIPDDT